MTRNEMLTESFVGTNFITNWLQKTTITGTSKIVTFLTTLKKPKTHIQSKKLTYMNFGKIMLPIAL